MADGIVTSGEVAAVAFARGEHTINNLCKASGQHAGCTAENIFAGLRDQHQAEFRKITKDICAHVAKGMSKEMALINVGLDPDAKLSCPATPAVVSQNNDSVHKR